VLELFNDFYTPEDGILHSHRRENLKFYIALTGWTAMDNAQNCDSCSNILQLSRSEDDSH
jgi:hypothetical protein